MKFISICILIFFTSQVFGQKKQTKNWRLDLDSISAKGIKIVNWKYHQGDNTQWKDRDVDDSKWKILKASDSYNDLDDFNKKSIGWLRATLHKDTLPQTIAITISHGESERRLSDHRCGHK